MTMLTNDFHGTEYQTTLSPQQVKERHNAFFGASYSGSIKNLIRWVRTVRQSLCSDDCRCGGDSLGRRGTQLEASESEQTK